MDYQENLYYGLGQIAYAVAKADGEIQQKEKEKLHDIVLHEIEHKQFGFNFSDVIFHLLQKDKRDFESAYEQGLAALKLSSHLITDEIAAELLSVITKVAEAFPPITNDEQSIISRFTADLQKIRTYKPYNK